MIDIKSFSVFNIIDFGAEANTKKLCTSAFELAINECEKLGGGTVYVPSGIFFTGPIQMKSNITLYFSSGAKVFFSDNYEDYPLVKNRWEGKEQTIYCPLIYGENLENVTVAGRGLLDGQGAKWWKLFKEKKLEYPRPQFVCFKNSKNVLIEDITLKDSPFWTINPLICRDVTVNKVSINNPSNSPNTDGINPESCKNVHITNCNIDVGDDCIAIKAGTEKCEEKIPCENITITNCAMINGHGAVVIGSEMSGSVRNISISNCSFDGTDRGIRLKSRRGRGGAIEDITVSNVVMNNVRSPITMQLFYFCGEDGKLPIVGDKNFHPVTETTPKIRNIYFSNILAKNTTVAAGFIYGLPEMPIEDICFENVSISMAEVGIEDYPGMMSGIEKVSKKGFICNNAKGVNYENIKIKGQDGPAYIIDGEEK